MKALLMMGCPELPVQTAAVLYIANKLSKEGIEVTAAGNKAAVSLLLNSDPENHYIKKVMDLDRCIGALAEKNMDFDLCFVFIHSDSGISYLATIKSISNAKTIAVIFGNAIEPLMEACNGSIIIAAKAVHNPMPLKAKIDGVSSWAALKK